MNVHSITILSTTDAGPSTRQVRLKGESWLSIGRDPTNDIVIIGEIVSRNHARICVRNGQVVAEDLDSQNGTYIVGGDGGETQLTSRTEHNLELSGFLRIGRFLFLPCEIVGENVFLSQQDLFELPSQDFQSAETVVGRQESRLKQALALKATEDPLEWILDVFMELTKGSRGFLFTLVNDRLIRKIDRGVDGPIILSQKFLEATAKRETSWTAVTGMNYPEGLESESLNYYHQETRLTGVPVLNHDGQTQAVVYLESSETLPPNSDDLATFSQVAAPLIEMHLALDRETRRREAVEGHVPGSELQASSDPDDDRGPKLIGRNAAFLVAAETIRRAASTSSIVIIRGPSGSGKGELARLLHSSSNRKEQPFVVINAAALPETLVESELFGHEEGAFTGAVRKTAGAFARADGGTLFLDEIGDLGLSAQAKILKAVEDGEIRPLGGVPRRIDVRVVTATHRDLEQMVKDGEFRQDLFYRVSVIEVQLPSLAERPEDILALAEHFLTCYRRPDGERVAGFSPPAVRLLTAYNWPGNIRELRNIVERAVVLDQDGIVDTDDLSSLTPSDERNTDGINTLLALSWPEARKQFEKHFFELALARNQGRVADTAKEIDVSRRTVTTKIQEHEIKPR